MPIRRAGQRPRGTGPSRPPIPPATTTCQLCGRAIHSKTGVIAHHGYQRPGEGWQTSSCRGARRAPYEVSCECLKEEIELMGSALANTKTRLADMISNPPEILTQMRRPVGVSVYYKADEIIHTRPSDFNVEKTMAYSSVTNTYGGQFVRGVHALQRDERGITDYLKFLEARLAAWVAPAAKREV